MKYLLNLAVDKHILSACVPLQYVKYDGMPIVEGLPEGDITDYRYVNGEYIYDPLPEPNPVESEPTTDEVLNALLGV